MVAFTRTTSAPCSTSPNLTSITDGEFPNNWPFDRNQVLVLHAGSDRSLGLQAAPRINSPIASHWPHFGKQDTLYSQSDAILEAGPGVAFS